MSKQRLFSIRLIAAALAMLPWTTADASGTVPEARPAALAASAGTGAPPSLEETMAVRDRANQLTISGRWSEARRHWARLARMQRARGELPVEASWAQAEVSHALGLDVEAASVLKRLGDDALAAGNIELSAQVYLEAAVLYRRGELRNEARLCMDQVVRLLRSSSFDPQRREWLESRIVRG